VAGPATTLGTRRSRDASARRTKATISFSMDRELQRHG
jgi:hypothetical protein